MVKDDVGILEVCVGVGDMQVDESVNYRIPITVETQDETACEDGG